ncbi:hypothetical protein [Fibrisoma limi]|nr:hypothetical protein [Fibrisoma limi]
MAVNAFTGSLMWFVSFLIVDSGLRPVLPDPVSVTYVIERPGPLLTQTPAAATKGWAYEKTADKFKGRVQRASLVSANTIQFDYPYTGKTPATLTIRERDGSTTVYIEVDKGQFNRSFQNGSAKVRFDGKAPVTYPLTAAANGRANIVFFDADQKLINQIKAARTMTVAINFYGQPVRQLEFRTAGLRWPL